MLGKQAKLPYRRAPSHPKFAVISHDSMCRWCEVQSERLNKSYSNTIYPVDQCHELFLAQISRTSCKKGKQEKDEKKTSFFSCCFFLALYACRDMFFFMRVYVSRKIDNF